MSERTESEVKPAKSSSAEAYLSIRRAAQKLDVAYNTIRNAILAGGLAAYKIQGTYRINPVDLADYVERCRVEVKGRVTGPPAPKSHTLKHLDGARLRAAWTARGVRVPRPGGDSARSSGSTRDPSDGPAS